MDNKTVNKLEALLDTALDHFSHGWVALEKQGMVTYKDPDVFPPSVSDEVGSASYHFAAVADTVKRAYEIIAAEQSSRWIRPAEAAQQPRAADGYAVSQQSGLFAVGDEPAKVSDAKRRR